MLAAIVAALAGAPVLADDAGLLIIGGDVDDDSGYRVNLGGSWSPTQATVFSLFAARADTATDFGDFIQTSAQFGVDHFFGPVGLTGQVRWSDDEDLLAARTFAGSVYFKGGPWRLAVHGEMRDADFDAFDFNTMIPVRTPSGVQQLPVSGRANCNLDNAGYGVFLSRNSGAWFVSAGGMTYDYDDSDCDVSNIVLPPELTALPVLSREIFRRIAARALDTTGQLVSSQLTRENGLLDSTLSLGLQYQSGMRTWGMEYYRDREEFAGLKSHTVVGSLTFPVGGRSDLEVRLGATDGDVAGTVGFAGLTVYVYLGGGGT